MRLATAIALVAATLVALPAFAGQTFHWYAFPIDPAGPHGPMVFATGLPDVPFIELLKVPGASACGPFCVETPSVYIPPTDFSAAAFDSPGEALGPYYVAKFKRGLLAWLFVVDQQGTTVLVTRPK